MTRRSYRCHRFPPRIISLKTVRLPVGQNEIPPILDRWAKLIPQANGWEGQ